VVYTGTHDNDTTLGWWHACSETTRETAMAYLAMPSEPMPWPLIQTALNSVAQLAVVPAQDLMALGSEARMNTPGTTGDNWQWQLQPGAPSLGMAPACGMPWRSAVAPGRLHPAHTTHLQGMLLIAIEGVHPHPHPEESVL